MTPQYPEQAPPRCSQSDLHSSPAWGSNADDDGADGAVDGGFDGGLDGGCDGGEGEWLLGVGLHGGDSGCGDDGVGSKGGNTGEGGAEGSLLASERGMPCSPRAVVNRSATAKMDHMTITFCLWRRESVISTVGNAADSIGVARLGFPSPFSTASSTSSCGAALRRANILRFS